MEWKQIQHMHAHWIQKYSPVASKVRHGPLYEAMFLKGTRTDTVTQFQLKQDTLRESLLRDAIASFSASPEAYLATRTQFERTTATLNVCQYILGIGDRHLSNFMVDTKTLVLRQSEEETSWARKWKERRMNWRV